MGDKVAGIWQHERRFSKRWEPICPYGQQGRLHTSTRPILDVRSSA
jgi:hypothetical protein